MNTKVRPRTGSVAISAREWRGEADFVMEFRPSFIHCLSLASLPRKRGGRCCQCSHFLPPLTRGARQNHGSPKSAAATPELLGSTTAQPRKQAARGLAVLDNERRGVPST